MIDPFLVNLYSIQRDIWSYRPRRQDHSSHSSSSTVLKSFLLFLINVFISSNREQKRTNLFHVQQIWMKLIPSLYYDSISLKKSWKCRWFIICDLMELILETIIFITSFEWSIFYTELFLVYHMQLQKIISCSTEFPIKLTKPL